MSRVTNILVWTLGACAGILIAGMLVILVLVNHSRRELADYRKDLEARGESLDYRALAPPAPPTKDNGAQDLIAACRALNEKVKEQAIPRFRMLSHSAPPGTRIPYHLREQATIISADDKIETEVSWENAAKLIESLDPEFQLLRKSAMQPHLETRLDYSAGASMNAGAIIDTLRACQYLNYSALINLHDGHRENALKDIQTELAMAVMAQREISMITQLVAANEIDLAQWLTWEFLQSASLTEEELQDLQTMWENVRLTTQILPTIRMERAMMAPYFSRPTNGNLLSSISPSSGRTMALRQRLSDQLAWMAWSVFFRQSDELSYLQFQQKIIEACKQASVSGSWAPAIRTIEQQESKLPTGNISHRLGHSLLSTSTSGIVSVLVSAEALRELTRTAIAIKRFQLDTGNCPATLEELVPKYLSTLPLDPFDGKPLRYRLLANNHFLLYSIGPDGIDEQGNPQHSGKKKGMLGGKDIVWPTAADPENNEMSKTSTDQ